MPQVQRFGRCLAIDLIGMGRSDKLDDSGPDRYTFVEHRQYFDAALDALGVTSDVTFVVHDWGSALGFDWANRHRSAVKAICSPASPDKITNAILVPTPLTLMSALNRVLSSSVRNP